MVTYAHFALARYLFWVRLRVVIQVSIKRGWSYCFFCCAIRRNLGAFGEALGPCRGFLKLPESLSWGAGTCKGLLRSFRKPRGASGGLSRVPFRASWALLGAPTLALRAQVLKHTAKSISKMMPVKIDFSNVFLQSHLVHTHDGRSCRIR